VSASDILKYDSDAHLIAVNLDVKNPRGKEDITHLPPEQIVSNIQSKEHRIAEIMVIIESLLKRGTNE
jgi:hypothetical protein